MDLSFFGYWKEIDREFYIMVLSRKTCFALNLRNLIKICKRPRICSEKRKSSMKSILRGAFKSPTSLNENILCIMNSPFHQQLKKSTQSYEKKMAFARHGRSTWKTKKHFLASFCALQITSQSQIFFGERHQIKSQEFPHQLCMDLILSVCGGQTNLFYEITETLVCIQPSYLNKI